MDESSSDDSSDASSDTDGDLGKPHKEVSHSEFASEADDRDSGSSDHEPLPDINKIGIQQAAKAVSGKSKCWICELLIPKGERRVHYRTRNSRSFEHLRWLHTACAARLPDAQRANDIRVVQSWLRRPGITEDDKTMFTDVLDRLRP